MNQSPKQFLFGFAMCAVLLATALPLAVLVLKISSQNPVKDVYAAREMEDLSIPGQSEGGSDVSAAEYAMKNVAANPVTQDKKATKRGKGTKETAKRKNGKTGGGRMTDPPPISTDFVNPPTAEIYTWMGVPMFERRYGDHDPSLPRAGLSSVPAQGGGNGTPGGSAAEQKEPAGQEITLVLEGKVYDGVFTFEGNRIVYFHRNAWGPLLPEDITVDGKPWKDLTKPFELDYTPDYAKAVILEKEIDDVRGVTLYSTDDTKKFCLSVGEPTSWEGQQKTYGSTARLYPFRVKLAMKNQLPHMEVIWKNIYAPSKNKTPSAAPKGSLEFLPIGGIDGSATNTP